MIHRHVSRANRARFPNTRGNEKLEQDALKPDVWVSKLYAKKKALRLQRVQVRARDTPAGRPKGEWDPSRGPRGVLMHVMACTTHRWGEGSPQRRGQVS